MLIFVDIRRYATEAQEERVARKLRKLKRQNGGRALYEIEGEQLLLLAKKVKGPYQIINKITQ